MIGSRLGHYEILESLGAGGMGHVYLAHDTKLDREVALKVLPQEVADDPERLRRLQREAQALAALDHPGIVTIFSVEEEQGVHFLTMARIKGGTLDHSIPPEGLPLERLLALGTQLADALRAAHEQGIVHRDLKPSNIMVDSEDRLRVLDFGLSRLDRAAPLSSQLQTETIDEALTRRGVVLGTVPYMSPEQAEGRPLGPASDLFSFGVVLYEMATGERPFQGASSAALISSIMRDDPPRIAERRPDLPETLARLISRCLEKEPEKRYENAKELRDDLETMRREAIFGESATQSTNESRRSLTLLALGTALVAIVALVGTMVWQGERHARTAQQRVASQPIRSVAVLPLLDLSGNPDQAHFADGMTEALINNLARINALKVVSRTSIMRFKETELSLPEIARELGVDAIVEGSVQRDTDTIRIAAQLVDAATDRYLWGDDFERRPEGVLQMQSEVAQSIAEAIAVRILPEEESRLASAREVDPQTYDAYLRGRYLLDKGTPEDLQKGMGLLQRAVDSDPTDPLAYAGLASGYVMLGHATGDPQYIRRAKAAAQRALQLDDSHAEAQATLASVAMYFEWDWSAADSAFQRAIDLNPNNAEVHAQHAFLQLLHGDFAPAAAEIELARELDPLSPSVSVWAAELYWPFGRYDLAERAALEALELNPDFPHAQAWLGQTYLGQGRFDEALQHARIAAEGNPRWVPYLGRALALSGHRKEAQELLDELVATPDAGHTGVELAVLQTVLGDMNGAMDTLEQAYAAHEIFMPWVGSFPDYGELLHDPRFQDLLQRLGLEYVRPQLLADAARI